MSREISHTPGPWEVKHSESKTAFNVIGTILGGRYKLARCPYFIIEGSEELTVREKEEAEANAKLIAAAPELLEALQTGAMTLAEKLKRLGADDPNVSPTYRKMVAAIEKATLTTQSNAE